MHVILAALVAAIGSVGASIDVGQQACGVTAAGQYFYVDAYASGTLLKIDPRTNKVVKRIVVGTSPCGMATGAGALWVEDWGANRIVRVDLKTMKVTHRIKTGRHPWDVAFAF